MEHFKNLAEARQKTHTGQKATAKSMLKASNKKQMSIKINDLTKTLIVIVLKLILILLTGIFKSSLKYSLTDLNFKLV